MGRKAYFPDTMFNNKEIKTTACTTPISTIESNSVQNQRKGGSCYILAPFKALLLKKGPDALKKIITDDEHDKNKAIVHFYYKGEPYDITIDKTVIDHNTFHDFSDSSDDIRMIIKAFILAGFVNGADSFIDNLYDSAKYDESTNTYKTEYKLNSISKSAFPNGGDLNEIMQLLSPGLRNTDQQFISDTSEAINSQKDLEDALLNKLNELRQDTDTIVCLGIYMKNSHFVHAVTFTDVDLDKRQIISFDQKLRGGRIIKDDLDELLSPTNELQLNNIYSYKLDKTSGEPTAYSQIDIKELQNVITDKKKTVTEEFVINSLREKFGFYCEDNNYKHLKQFAKDFPQQVNELIKVSARNHKIVCNNSYELNKYILAKSKDAAAKDTYTKLQSMFDDVLANVKNMYPELMASRLFREKLSSDYKDEWKTFIDGHASEVEKLIRDVMRNNKYSWKDADDINKVIHAANTAEQKASYTKQQTIMNDALKGIKKLYMQSNRISLLKAEFDEKFKGTSWRSYTDINKEAFQARIFNILESGKYSWNDKDEFDNMFSAEGDDPSQRDAYQTQQTILKSMMLEAKELYDENHAAFSSSIKLLNPKGEPLAYAYAKLVTAHSMKVPTSIISTKWNAVMKVTSDITDCVNAGKPVTADLRQQAYNACRIYLDEHTDYSRRQDSIDGQHFLGGRLRKAAVVNYLKEMCECKCLEGFDNLENLYKQHCKAKKIEYKQLNFNCLEKSLASHMPPRIKSDKGYLSVTDKAYAELNTETSRKLKQWQADRTAAKKKTVSHNEAVKKDTIKKTAAINKQSESQNIIGK